ncbi:hypothetical protein J3F83DRAFT_740445 [Trichoderma novae-zelandiae]
MTYTHASSFSFSPIHPILPRILHAVPSLLATLQTSSFLLHTFGPRANMQNTLLTSSSDIVATAAACFQVFGITCAVMLLCKKCSTM